MAAVIKTGGKQYRVNEGDIIYVEKLNANEGDEVKFEEVLMIDSKIGTPTLDGAAVTAKVLKQGKAKKITVFTYKAKKNEKRKLGHRQPYTKVQIEKING